MTNPTPPAEQAAPKAAPVTQQAGYAEVIECGNLYAKVKLKGEAFGSVRVGDIFYTALQQDDAYDHGPQAETVEEAARDVGKWLNERPNRPLDLRRVAMLTHHANRTAHVQNPAEIEHVAGDVSKNGAESDMAQQPAPSAAAASKAVLAAIRAANMQLVRTGDDAFMLVTYKNAKAQCDGGKCGMGGYCDDCPTPQSDSQPAPEYVGNGMFKGETIQKAAEHWANWCDRRCMNGLAEFLRVVAAHAPTDSQPAATGRIAELEDALSSCLQLVNQLNEHHIPDGCSRLIRHIKDAAATVSKAQASAPADSVTASADGANWQDISTAPKDGTRFVAVGNNYGLYSEAQHSCIAQWFRGCWMEVSDWNDASELKYLTHWMPLPPLPGSAASATANSDGWSSPDWMDECRQKLTAHVAKGDPANSVREDAARWQWLADYLIGERTDLDKGIVACATIDALRQFADAARKQGENHD